MSESPYAIPAEDLFDSARVPVAEQFVEQPGAVGSSRPTGRRRLSVGDGFGGDADGE